MAGATAAVSTSASLVKLATQSYLSTSSIPAKPSVSGSLGSTFGGASLPLRSRRKNGTIKSSRQFITAAVVTLKASEEITEYALPSWAMFELGRAPVFWKTVNGLPPTAGEKLKVFYNPAATKLVPNNNFGIAFNGGFNQPIMCGGEPRAMLKKTRGKADPPIYTIQIRIPTHAVNLIFSFTNGVDWDGPYRLQFQVPKRWKHLPIEFFNEGLAEELSKEGACDRAIFPDTNLVIDRCSMIGNLTLEGGDRCNLDLVPGCMDPSSHLYNPLANVEDGSCEVDLED